MSLFVAGAGFGEVHVSLFAAGAAFGELHDFMYHFSWQAQDLVKFMCHFIFAAGAAFGELHVSLFVAGAALVKFMCHFSRQVQHLVKFVWGWGKGLVGSRQRPGGVEAKAGGGRGKGRSDRDFLPLKPLRADRPVRCHHNLRHARQGNNEYPRDTYTLKDGRD